MSMKIAKKILAGTLALMSTFIAVSAAPVEIEKPTGSSTSAKNEESIAASTKNVNDKNSKGKIKSKLFKGVSITAGVFATLFAIPSTYNFLREEESCIDMVREFSCYIFSCYLYPDRRKFIEEHKDTKLGKIFIYIFDLLDGKRESKRPIEGLLELARTYRKICRNRIEHDEIKNFLEKIEEPLGNVLNEDLPVGNACDLSEVFKICSREIKSDLPIISVCPGYNIQNFEGSSSVSSGGNDYELKVIVESDVTNHFYTAAYVRQEGEAWERCSLDGKKGTCDFNFIKSRFRKISGYTLFVYENISEQSR